MSSLLIVTGPPGAGKSTVSKLLVDAISPSVLVEGDAFFAFLAGGAIDPWLPESQHQNEVVTEAAASATGRFALDYDTVYEGVVGPWFLPVFAAATGLTMLDYVILLPSSETCVARVTDRRDHGFSDEAATGKMHHEFARAEVDRRHVIAVDDEVSPSQLADVVLDRRARSELAYDVTMGARQRPRQVPGSES